MSAYFRITELTAPATVLRQGNLLDIHLGDFIYPEEVQTISCTNTVGYWDDNTCERFTWAPGDIATVVVSVVETSLVEAPVIETLVEEAPAEGVVPSDVETGSKSSKA